MAWRRVVFAWSVLACAALGLFGAAWAGTDGHGAPPWPDDGASTQPIWGWRPADQQPGTGAAGAALHAGRAPLVLRQSIGGDEVDRVLLGDFLAVNLSATWAVHRRVGLAMNLPFFALAGPDVGGRPPVLGDLLVMAPIGLVLPGRDGTGLGVGVSPVLRVPTGRARRYVGDGAAGIGGRLAVGWGVRRLRLSASGGVDWRSLLDPLGAARRGVVGSVELGAGWMLTPSLGLWLEGRALAPGLGGEAPPVEVMIGARGRQASGLWWSAGLGGALTEGAGGSALRLLVGVGYASTQRVARIDTAQEGPDLQRFVVLDPRGRPISGAEVQVGEQRVGATDGRGTLVVTALRWSDRVMVRAEGYEAAEVARTGAPEVPVVLPFVPSEVAVRVQDQAGRPVVGSRVTLSGHDPPRAFVADATGLVEARVDPGTWEIEVVAEGYGRQVRGLLIPPGVPRERIEVILLPSAGRGALQLTVQDPTGAPVDGARLTVDGAPVGSVGSAGTLAVDGLAPGPHALALGAQGYQDLETEASALEDGPNPLTLTMRREPGGVLVIARGPGGPVSDAVVRFDGPSRLPPLTLGRDGRRVVQVRPGTWSVLVLSATHGLQKRTVEVPDDATALTVVEVVLRPEEGGAAELTLRVIDGDGAPVPGAEVVLDGVSYGRTASGGSVTLAGLAEGPRTLEVRGEWLESTGPLSLFLVRGAQERTVEVGWRRGVVRVRARSPEGEVRDGVVRFAGTSDAPALALGPFGEATTLLAPGAWEALVISEEWGLQARAFRVPEDGGRRIDLDVVYGGLPPGDADLTIRVVRPDRAPVEGARVAVDGNDVGATSTEGTVALRGVAAGRRRVTVTAPLHRAGQASVTLRDGGNQVEVPLAWAPGSARLVALGPEGAVGDAVVRLAGPEAAPSVHLGASGARVVRLAEGRWQALAVSPTWGLHETTFVVPKDARTLVEVPFTFGGEPVDRASVLLRVEDPAGRPVARAAVLRDGAALATTGAGGAALLGGLPPGDVTLAIEAPGFAPATLQARLPPGATERIVRLEWVPRGVRVRVRDPAGAPVAATLSAEGPGVVPTVRTDAAGEGTLSLTPGSWHVVADGGAAGSASSEVRVTADGALEPTVFTLGGTLVDLTDAEVRIREQVRFDFDRATLRAESRGVLDQIAATLLGHPELGRVEVQGHTDDTGGARYNLELSQRRAEAVVAALVARGVAPERLHARGYGFTRPLVPNDTDDGRAANRRVQFDILERAAP